MLKLNYTPEQLQEMLDAATGGEWYSTDCGFVNNDSDNICAANMHDAPLIAASRKIAEDALELHAALTAKEAECERLREALEDVREQLMGYGYDELSPPARTLKTAIDNIERALKEAGQ